VFGDGITTAASLAYQRSLLAESGKTMVLVSSRVVDDVKGTSWEYSFTRVDNFEEETFLMVSNPEEFSKPP
jgi:hypothetical protein